MKVQIRKFVKYKSMIIFWDINLNKVFDNAQKKDLIKTNKMVLLSTHNICFG